VADALLLSTKERASFNLGSGQVISRHASATQHLIIEACSLHRHMVNRGNPAMLSV